MSKGAIYFGLLANLRQNDMLHEARSRRYSTDTIRPRRTDGFGTGLLRFLRIKR